MFTKSTLLHLRIPFSFYLLPVFLFAVYVVGFNSLQQLILVFVSIHIFLYPASNGFNSYYDKDEKSIGGLQNPPPVSIGLLWISLLFDLIAVLIAWIVSWQFAIMLLVYGLISKAYSHPRIRLKKYPIIGWLTVSFFQGFFIFISVVIAFNPTPEFNVPMEYILAASLSSLLLMGSYPMTQIYQHQEDKERGDITLSIKLGILGTFRFTALMFLVSSTAYFLFFTYMFELTDALVFVFFLSPVLIYFLWWYFLVRKDWSKANFQNTMTLNLVSSLSLCGFFIWGILGDAI